MSAVVPPSSGETQLPRSLIAGSLSIIGVSFVALAWSSQSGLGMLWDEKVDLGIASRLLEHPIYGSGEDGSQMRLPMLANAIVFTASGPGLGVSRGVSIAVGLVTILATFGLCRRLLDGPTALLAAALTALGPYFLSFSRIAMTEGDVFAALFVTLACWAYANYSDRPNGPRLALASIGLGLAIGAKLYSLFLIPVFGLCELIRARVRRNADRRRSRGDATPGTAAWGWVIAASSCLTLGAASAGLAQGHRTTASIAVWGLLLGLTAGVLISLARRGEWHPSRSAGWVLIGMLGLAVTGAAMPQHIVNPEIARTIARRAAHWDHLFPGALWLDHLRLYSGIVLICGTVPVGLATVTALIWAWMREGDRPEVRLPIFAATFFVLSLTLLPLRQTFYLMSIWPLLMILTAGWLVTIRRWLGKQSRTAGVAGTALIVVVVGLQAASTVHAWPDYNLYARRWVGTRWLGAEARGYRNLVQTPCDGYAELVDWCLENAPRGGRVVSYLWADHVLDGLLPDGLPFTLVRRGVWRAANLGLPVPAPPGIDDADVVLIHINNQVEYDDMPPADVLSARFGGAAAFTVYRDGDFPMAMAYRVR
ncbi:MAG: glycosyltransferase family 39 protein [Phycisphaerae bacterium]|nr:glycosyltransferase family 39 protein [Phycisphaerae bacterium]